MYGLVALIVWSDWIAHKQSFKLYLGTHANKKTNGNIQGDEKYYFIYHYRVYFQLCDAS